MPVVIYLLFALRFTFGYFGERKAINGSLSLILRAQLLEGNKGKGRGGGSNLVPSTNFKDIPASRIGKKNLKYFFLCIRFQGNLEVFTGYIYSMGQISPRVGS